MPHQCIAINIVLLPDTDLRNMILAYNKQLCARFEQKIVLGTSKYVPHLTLCMATIYRGALDEVKALVKETAMQFDPFIITTTGTRESSEGFSVLQVRNTSQLTELHNLVTNRLAPYALPDALPVMFFDETAQPASIQYVNQFISNKSGSHFSPHLTVGYGSMQSDPIPASYTASNIALCHLGDYCTCAQIITQARLR